MNLRNKIKLIIFDMDGLMLDTEIIHFKTWMMYAQKYGFKYDITKRHRYAGMTDKQVVSALSKDMGDAEKASQMRHEILEERKRIFSDPNISLKKEGLIELLDYLDLKNISYVIASSSGRDRIKYLLEKEGILQRFNVIISGDDVEKSKPAPDIFLKAIEIMNCSKDEALILEDSENGYIAAKESGINYIIIPDSSFENNYLSVEKTCKNLFSVIDKLEID